MPADAERRRTVRTKKRGTVGGLTVFVVAVAAVLLIPIGRSGLPRRGDPYGHDRPF